MDYYLSDIIPRLQKYSAKLDQSSLLVDKPWVVSNSSGPFEKLIFRRDGRVHLSSDGNVKDGKWEYLPEAQSLLIDYGKMKKLYRHQYLDEAVLALKQDGINSDDDYFLLANENTVPNCDAKEYLRNKYLRENNVEIKLLANSKEMELSDSENEIPFPKKAIVDGNEAENGEYLLADENKKIIVKDGIVADTLSKVDYLDNISVWQKSKFYPTEGDFVEGLENGKFTITDDYSTYTIYVEDSVVVNRRDHFYRYLGIFALSIIGFIVFLIILL